MIDGDVNLGVILGEMQLMFSYQDGGLVSLKRKDGIQWMIRPPVPVYWRASTDNDRGNGFAKERQRSEKQTRKQSLHLHGRILLLHTGCERTVCLG